MNAGAAAARGDVLLFLHADTRLPAGFDAAVLRGAGRPGGRRRTFRRPPRARRRRCCAWSGH